MKETCDRGGYQHTKKQLKGVPYQFFIQMNSTDRKVKHEQLSHFPR